jgi:hypothetical protein
MRKDTLKKLFEELFSFLTDDFNFKIIKSRDEDWGYSYLAVNDTTGIEINYEFTQAYVNIMVYKLIDGEIIKNTVQAIKNEDLINGFSLDLIVEVRNPKDLIKPAYQYGMESDFYKPKVGLKNYISLFAENLKKYAFDILNGDFSIFTQLDEIMKKKYKDYYK